MVDVAIRIGDLVRERTSGFVWKVVDQDDDGTTYIEHAGVRSFTSIWNLEPITAETGRSTDPKS